MLINLPCLCFFFFLFAFDVFWRAHSKFLLYMSHEPMSMIAICMTDTQNSRLFFSILAIYSNCQHLVYMELSKKGKKSTGSSSM